MFLRKVLSKKPGLLLRSRAFFSTQSLASQDTHAVKESHDTHDSHETHDSHHDHGHGHKEYDWRDDPKLNKELEEDIRDRGWNPETYTFPYSGTMPVVPVYPDNYDPSNLKMNFYPERKKNEHPIQNMRVF